MNYWVEKKHCCVLVRYMYCRSCLFACLFVSRVGVGAKGQELPSHRGGVLEAVCNDLLPILPTDPHYVNAKSLYISPAMSNVYGPEI